MNENPTNANEQLLLAMDYDPSLGGRDGRKAYYWYTKAAKQGNADAQNNLGYLLFYGRGIPSNKTKAKYWFTKAAKQGNEKAKNNLDKGGFEDVKGIILSIIGAIILAAIVFGIMSLINKYSALVHISGAVAGWIIVREMRKRL